MAITIDATVGGASSNSYLTPTRAAVLAEQLPHGAEWFTNIDINKSQLLVYATRLIDQYGYYYGSKASTTQALAFPRAGLVYLPEGDVIPNNVIPTFIEWATIEWAVSLIEASDLTPSGFGMKSLKTPSFTIDFASGISQGPHTPRVVTDLLKPYARRVGMNYVRVLRT